jgi:hypothetical protein
LKGISLRFKDKVLNELSRRVQLDKTYRSVVNNKLSTVSQVKHLKKGVLTLIVKDNGWGQQLIFFKHKIIHRMKNKRLNVKQVVITIDPEAFDVKSPVKPTIKSEKLSEDQLKNIHILASIPNNQDLSKKLENILILDQRFRNDNKQLILTCKSCGKLLDNSAVCILCHNKIKLKKKRLIRTVLDDTPWVSYADISEELTEVNNREFEDYRIFYIRQLYDRITQGSYELFRENNQQMKERLQKLCSNYLSLKTRLRPDQLTDQIVLDHLGKKKSQIIFNLS